MVEISGNKTFCKYEVNDDNIEHKRIKEQVGDYSQTLETRKARKVDGNFSSKKVVG